MSKFFSLIAKAPKRLAALVLVLAAVVAVPALSNAWGPTRDTYTIEHPADHVTFNSITNNPNYGDERNAVTIKSADSTTAGGWSDDVTVQNGKEYYVRMYVHNNAASNLNLVAHDVKARFNIPTQRANRIQVDGYLSSSNAKPTEIWDQAVFHGDGDFTLSYVNGSATYTNNIFPNGTPLPDSVSGSGAQLGYKKMDGDIPGCFQYSGYVIFKVKASTADFSISKTVRVNGATDTTFKESVNATAGGQVDYQIYFKNTGNMQLKNVVIKDTLPAGISYVEGSTYLHTSSGTNRISDGITTAGINIGGYLPEGDAYIKFTAKVADKSQLVCGTNTLRNSAKATTEIGSKTDTADVTVTKDCQQPPVYTCDLLTKTLVTGTQYKFNGKASASNGATITGYTLDFGDGSTPYTGTSVANVSHTYPQANKSYTARLTATVNVNGSTKTVTSDACAVKVDVSCPPVKIQVCDLTTKKVITINEKDFDAKKHSKNLDDCKQIQVCELSTYKVITIAAFEFDAKKHSKNLDDCKPPVKIQVCDLATKKVITINEKDFDAKKHSKNLDDCKPVVNIQVCDLATKKVITINEKDFDAKKHSKNLDDCKPPKQIQVCDLTTKKVITINEKDFDAKKHSKNLDDCKPVVKIQVCDLATNTVVTINEKDFDESKYSKDIENCKPPVKITVCDLTTKQVVSIDEKDFDAKKHSKNLDDCKSTPMCTVPGKEHLPADSTDCVATPPELPHTGIGDGIVTTFGIGSLIASASYYIASRRGLNR